MTPRDQPSEGQFGQVTRDPSLADKVVQEITEAIVSGRLRAGERLDSERELAEQFGVSRTVIREAVRSLVGQGLVETRAGRGVLVAAIGDDTVSRSMSLYLRSNPAIDYRSVHEVRSGLEIEIAGLAAERADDEDLRQLRELNDELAALTPRDPERAAHLDVEFHMAIAAATKNPLYKVLLASIGDVMLDVRRAAFADEEMMRYAVEAHGAILARLDEHDSAGAREAMRLHLEDAQNIWLGRQLPGRDV
jgi:GntR family transcriptional repressor for pyruvate dehydrogenase complex